MNSGIASRSSPKTYRIPARREIVQVLRLLKQTCADALRADHGLNPKAAKARLNAELNYYRKLRLEQRSLRDVFRQYCLSLANRGRVEPVILGPHEERKAIQCAYAKVLCGYNQTKIAQRYRGRSDRLLEQMVKARGLTRAQRRRQLQHPRSQFHVYIDGVLAGAEYFSQYRNGRHFAAFVRRWLSDPDHTAMLPEYFRALELPGFGAALAADFLKELGVKKLGKPDRWVKRCLCAAGWTGPNPSAFAVQRLLWRTWRKAGPNYPPIIVDKLMYLVGSGKYAMAKPEYRCRSRLTQLTRAIRHLQRGNQLRPRSR